MFEEKRRCASCGRVPGWSEIVVNCSDQKRICVDCVRKANLPDPPMNANGQVHPWDSMKFLKRINAHKQYEDFCKKEGTQKLLDGYFLINDAEKTFAVGSNDYDETLVGFQSASYENIESIAINDGVQTKSIKVSDGDSGAAGALFGGLLFGTLGAVVGGLGTREDATYGEIVQTNNIGFTITYRNTSHDMFNVLQLCLNYNFVNYDTQKDIYDKAKQLTVQICEELYKKANSATSAQTSSNSTMGASSVASSAGNLSININPNNVEPTIMRIEMFMEDGEWETAKAYVNAALDYFPTDHRLYLLSLCIDMRAETADSLRNCKHSFRDNSNYKRFTRFADAESFSKVEEILNGIEQKAEETRIQEAAEKAAMQAQQEEKERQIVQLKESYVDNLAQMREITKLIDKRITIHAGMAMYLSPDNKLNMTTPVGVAASQYNACRQEVLNWGEIDQFRWDGLFGTIGDFKIIGLTKNKELKFKLTAKIDKAFPTDNVKSLLWSDKGAGTFTYALREDGTVRCIQHETGLAAKLLLHGEDKTENLTDVKDILDWGDRAIFSTNSGNLVATNYSGNPAKDTSPWRHINNWKNVIKIKTVSFSKIPYGCVGLTSDGKVLTSMFLDIAIMKEVMHWEDVADIVTWPKVVIGIKNNGDVVVANLAGYAFVNACTEWHNIVKIVMSDTHVVGLRGDGGIDYSGTSIPDPAALQSEKWQNIVDIIPSGRDVVGVKADGSIVIEEGVGSLWPNIDDINGIRLFTDVTDLK